MTSFLSGKLKLTVASLIVVAIMGAICLNVLAAFHRSFQDSVVNAAPRPSTNGHVHPVNMPSVATEKSTSVLSPQGNLKPQNITKKAPPRIQQRKEDSGASGSSEIKKYDLRMCSADTQQALLRPRLSESELRWCKDAVDPNKGQVVVGKSWGKLSKRSDRDRFEALNCNSASTGGNPSCDDAWGDSHIVKWRRNIVVHKLCPGERGGVRCHANDLNDKYCVFNKAMIDFSRSHKTTSGRDIPMREFEKDYLTIDCDENAAIPGFELNHLYSSRRDQSKTCDVVVPGKTILYSHDNLRNMGHTWSDWLNVWLLLWLENLADKRSEINLVTVDSLRRYNDFDDLVNGFFAVYRGFKSIRRGHDFNGQRVCFEELITQSLPSRGFVWENWLQDLPCSFVGPSSLFQRWNLDLRRRFNVENITRSRHQVLLIVRSDKRNDWGSYRTSRLIRNTDEVVRTLRKLSEGEGRLGIPPFDLVIQDMGKVGDLEAQFRLIANTTVVIGTHGAGIVHSMHLPLGAHFPSGVLEIFPKGEFSPVRGHGNMVRRMGFQYSRLDLSAPNSGHDGCTVPPSELSTALGKLFHDMENSPSCILPSVLENPFLH
jgi:hypothetical protein